MKKSVSYYLLAGALCAFSSLANASALQLFEENAVSVGDFGAGGAAIAQDASTGFFNPAGLTRIRHKQIVASLDAANINIRFKGNATWSYSPLNLFPYTETGTAHGGTFNFIPQFHYLAPLTDKWALGFNVTSPFGLATNYGTHSLVRYFATRTELQSIDISPSLAYTINEQFSLGLGLDAERVQATFNAIAGIPGISGTDYDTLNENNAKDWGYGWHTGLLYQFNPQTRLGLAYRSQVRLNLRGDSKLTGPLAGGTSASQFRNNDLHANITLPASTMLSIYDDINSQWALMATLIYTQWNVFENLTLRNVQSVANNEPENINVNLPQHFRNSWRLAVGANYKINEKWLLRAGTGFDQTPVNNTDRNLRLPDGNRYALALGGHYQATTNLGFDLGWTHLFVNIPTIDHNASMGNQNTYINGRVHANADVFGTQLVWNVD